METVRVELPDPPAARVTVPGLRVTVGPFGETVANRPTGPAKPALISDMLDVPEAPARMLRLAGLAERPKSPDTVNVIATECADPPPVPVTVTV